MTNTIDIGSYIAGIYYNKTEINSALAEKADADHTHNDLYYTESEIDSAIETINGSISDLNTNLSASIATKADAGHDHNLVYAPKSHTHKKSEITDFDHGHQASAITYDQTTVDAALTSLGSTVGALQSANWDISIVTSLPNEQNAKIGKLYFLHDENEDATKANAFDEYIWTGTKFEKIGQRNIDLSDYVTDVNLTFSEGILGVSLT